MYELAPRGEAWSPGVNFGPRRDTFAFIHSQGWTLSRRMEGANKQSSPLGTNFSPGGQLYPVGQISPQGASLKTGFCSIF
jgi:hypothetical protein